MRRAPDEEVITAVVTALLASTGVTDLVSTRVYNNVPQNAVYPLVRVTLPTIRRQDTYGRLGASGTVDIDAVGQNLGDREGLRILDACNRALDFTRPTLTGHTTLGLAWLETARFEEVVNGIRTRHHIASLEVWTEQSSS